MSFKRFLTDPVLLLSTNMAKSAPKWTWGYISTTLYHSQPNLVRAIITKNWGFTSSFSTAPPTGQEISIFDIFTYNFWTVWQNAQVWSLLSQINDKNAKFKSSHLYSALYKDNSASSILIQFKFCSQPMASVPVISINYWKSPTNQAKNQETQ